MLSGDENELLAWAQSQEIVIKDVTPVKGFLEAGVGPGDAGVRGTRTVSWLHDGEAFDLTSNTAGSDGWEACKVCTRRVDRSEQSDEC